MRTIRLPRIPDRLPVRHVVHISPDLDQQLKEYAAAYRDAYGKAEEVADLIPAILSAFLKSDRDFMRTSKKIA